MSSTITQIQPWIDKLPTSVVMIRVRCGDSSMHTVATIAINDRGYKDTDSDYAAIWQEIDDIADSIADSLEDNGYGETHKKARLHAYNIKGKSIVTKSITATHGRIATQSGTDRAIERLTEGLLAATAENRKVIAILAETLTHRETRMTEAIDSALESREDALDADAYSMAMEMLNQGAEEETDPLKEQAASVLKEVAGMFTSQQQNRSAAGPTKEQIREWVNNPEFVKAMMEDPDIQADLYTAFMGSQSEEKEDKPDNM